MNGRTHTPAEDSKSTRVPAASCQDPIAAGLDGAFIHEGRTRKPMLVPADPEAVAFGTFVASGKPSHAIKRTSKGIGVCLVGGLTPQMVHNVARVAGIRTLGTPGQAIYVGSGVAVCHRAQPGPAQVTFARPVDLIAPDGKTILARGVREWKPEVAMHDTAVVFYR